MNALLALLAGSLIAEAAWHMPFSRLLQRAQETGRAAMTVMQSRQISDHWKEKALAAYSGRILGASLSLLALLLAIFGVFVALAFLGDRLLPGFSDYLVGWQGLIITAFGATGALMLRLRLSNA